MSRKKHSTEAPSDVETATLPASPSGASDIDSEYSEHQRTVAIAALKRALAQVEKAGDKAALEEGSYGVDLVVAIRGDLVVGKAVAEGEPSVVADFTSDELVAALVAWIPRSKLDEALGSAVGTIAIARRNGSEALEAKQTLESAKLVVTQLVPGIAKRRHLTKEVRRPARCGSVTGKPHIRVTGSVDEQSVSIAID